MKKSSGGKTQIVEEKVLETINGSRQRTKRNNSKPKQTTRSKEFKGKTIQRAKNNKGFPKTAAGGISLNTAFGNFGVDWLKPMNASQQMSVQRAVGKEVMPRWTMQPKSIGGEYADEVCGTDPVIILKCPPGGAKVGDILFEMKLSPVLFPKTRIARMAPLWSRFRFKRLAFEYCNVADATKSGQILAFYDPDPARKWENTEDNWETASSLASARPTQISQPQVWDIPDPKFTNMYTTQGGADIRLEDQGQFLVIATSELNPAITPTLGAIFVKYIVEFFSPQNNVQHDPRTGVIVGQTNLTLLKPFGDVPYISDNHYNNLPSYTYSTSSPTASNFLFDLAGYKNGHLRATFIIPTSAGTFNSIDFNNDGLSLFSVVTGSTATNIRICSGEWVIDKEICRLSVTINGSALTITAPQMITTVTPDPLTIAARAGKEMEDLKRDMVDLKEMIVQLAEMHPSKMSEARKNFGVYPGDVPSRKSLPGRLNWADEVETTTTTSERKIASLGNAGQPQQSPATSCYAHAPNSSDHDLYCRQ